ncbi:hypothetical protein QUC31_020671 [Theobroma cacao]
MQQCSHIAESRLHGHQKSKASRGSIITAGPTVSTPQRFENVSSYFWLFSVLEISLKLMEIWVCAKSLLNNVKQLKLD